MAKRKAKIKPLQKALDVKPFTLADVVNVEEEAQNFQVPIERAQEIAKGIEQESTQLTLTRKISEGHLRDRFEFALATEIQRRNTCCWNECGIEFEDIVQAFAHLRWHLVNQTDDLKLSRAVMLDVEDRLWPQITASLSAKPALPPEERERLRQLHKERLRVDRQT